MQKNNYKIKFVCGELAERVFAIPPEGVLIGKSRAAAIRPGGADIGIEHAALYVRDADSSLILESRAESVFLEGEPLEPGAEAELTLGSEVRLGKNLVFKVEADDPSVPPPEIPADGDEETEDGTEDPTAEPGAEGTEDVEKDSGGGRTRYASVEELNDLRAFNQKRSNRKKATLAICVLLLISFIVGGGLYAEFKQENPLTWPGELSGRYNDAEFRIHLPPEGKFMVYYPECSQTKIEKTDTDCEIFTLLGKDREVLFHLKLEVNTLQDGYITSRKASFEQWKSRAEKEQGFTFLVLPEQRFYAMSTCGYPYNTMTYKRQGKNIQWQGIVSYLRYHDKEIIFIREVPIQHYWRAEKVLNTYGCFVASADASNSYWEIPEKLSEKTSKTEIYRSLLEEMGDNVAIIDWPEVERRFAVLLSAAGYTKDENMLKDALELLRELRERETFWYSQACLAYQHYQQNENWEMMSAIQRECLVKFPSQNDYRHTKIIRNIWTIDE